jgi:hypothetical protein
MHYIKAGEYPITEQQIRANHPHTSFPAVMEPEHVADHGYLPVAANPPVYNQATQTVTEATPELVNGIWRQAWTLADKPLAECKANLKALVAEKRWQVEMGGTTVAGIPLKTDAESQSKMTGALSFVARKPARAIKWKGADGSFTTLNKAQIEALSDGAGEFVALCFDAEAAHNVAINALATVADCRAYNINTGWPT